MNLTFEMIALYFVFPSAAALFMLVTGWHVKLLVYLVKTVQHLHSTTNNHHDRITSLERARGIIHHYERPHHDDPEI